MVEDGPEELARGRGWRVVRELGRIILYVGRDYGDLIMNGYILSLSDEDAATIAEALTTAAGRQILPPGGETRAEHNVRYRNLYGHWRVIEENTSSDPADDEWVAEMRRIGGEAHRVSRTVTTWPNGTTLTGPWQPAPEESTDG